jgi:hypothetical protein
MKENNQEDNQEDNQENNEIIINENNNTNINLLSELFKDYRKSISKKYTGLRSVTFSNVIDDNFRKDFYDLGDEKDNIDFSEMIKIKLDEIKNSSISQFQNYIDNVNKKYDEFKNKIVDFIESKKRKLSDFEDPLNNKAFILKYAKQNIFIKINNIFEIYDNIINSIEKNFELLNLFYENSILMNSKKQIEDFLINNSNLIENCSVVSKFNFTKLDTSNIKEIKYYKYYINYLSQKKIEDEEEVMQYILKKDDMKNGLGFIKENFSLLGKLTLKGIITEDFDNVLININENMKKNQKTNITKLNVLNFSSIAPKNEINIQLNMLRKLKMQYGAYINISKISKIFIENNNNLTSLSLEDINLTDLGFKSLISSLIKNQSITKTLEYLSLEGNKISMVKYDNEHVSLQYKYFQKLKWLILSRNNIYKFDFALNVLPNLKFLDLTSNDIPTSSFMEIAIKEKGKLVLLNDNMFITNSPNNNDIYIEYLNERIPKFDTQIKNLNLNFTYDIGRQNNLEQLKLTNNVALSLIKLDLSFCGITTGVLVNFFKKNPKFICLKQLILKYNNIKADFFEKIIDIAEICLDSINFLDLSENEIICGTVQKIESLYKFIEKNKYLETFRLINSNFFSDLITKMKDFHQDSDKFKKVLDNLLKNMTETKRSFKFIINEGNKSSIVEKYQCLFEFQFN